MEEGRSEARKKSDNSYRSILKGTSIFGGVQLFQIAVNLIRGKFVAMFLGPAGMGVASLFNTSSQTIQQLSGLGLNLAIVKEVAARKDDPSSLHSAVSVANTLIAITALMGALVCVIFALPLSRLTFGTDAYYWQFVLLGAVLFFGISGQGLLSMLQGLHEVKLISRTTITGSLTGLVIGVPLYALFGIRGIVPAMIVLAFTTFIANVIGIRKALPGYRGTFLWQTHKPLARKLIGLGLILMASDVIGAGCNYLVNLFIRYFGELENVGLYQAANSVTNQYSGLVFTAMMLDFFPRLSAAAKDNAKVREIVNRQLEIVSLIATPLICLLIVTSPLVIEILLTDQFMPIMPLMRWLGAGVLLKAIMFPLGYITFAKDNKSLFFWLEGVFGNLLFLGLSCLFYWWFGLIGLGYSLMIDCAICFTVYYIVNSRMYQYEIDRKAVVEILWAILLGGGCFACSFITHSLTSNLMMIAVLFIAGLRSAKTLRRLIRK